MSRRSLIGEALASPAPDQPSVSEAKDAAGATASRNFTTRRLEGFTEAARMVKRPTIRLKPAECSIWPGNARDYEQLTEPRLRSLIESIQAENGNRIPVVVRRKQQGELQYELIIGTRRHWAVAWLNANHYPDIELVAIIEDLDDEAAFRLADIENREREDISDLERGLNYKAAVDTYYDGLQARLAERVKISKSTLARYIGLLARIFVAAWLLVAVQLWIALRFASFVPALATGIAGTFFAVVATSARIGIVLPWQIPVNQLAADPSRANLALAIGGLGGCIALLAMLWSLSRREVV